ncbi:unnamed protein product [Tilletia laevis]|nr:unnamed protein product [Tilletia laevis]
MHVLTKLSLQILEVDTHFLRKINALGLYINCAPVRPFQFPVGPYAWMIISPTSSSSTSYARDPLHHAFKPSEFRTNGTTIISAESTTSNTITNTDFSQACELGLDEEFSDATDSSGSDLSESENELFDQQEEDAPSAHEDTDQVALLHDDVDHPPTVTDSILDSDLEDSSSTASDHTSMTHSDPDSDFEHTSATGTGLPADDGPERATPPPPTSSSAYVASPNASSSSSVDSSSATPTPDVPRPLKRTRLC